ncbi:DUF6276 family protein [Natronomonas amylolytica]|uniref:DUF6276 family protein n=1 Tax=Natronomonas amylolytica TaxID=3108498 RepID=UPI00300BA919
MDCPNCGAPMVSFAVPERFREHAPEESDHAALCPECLTLSAAESAPPTPRFDRITGTFPEDEAAVPLAIAIGLLDSLALHRRDIEALLEAVEEAGTDPLLIFDRLQAQGGVDPVFDLERRRVQVEQLLE